LRPKSDLVSRHHCVLIVEDSFVAVRDFGSRNGTQVNGERIVGERELRSGDRLVIGSLEFEVVVSAAPSVTKRPRVNSIKEAAVRTVAGPLQPSGDASQWLQDGDSDGGETIADTAALTIADTEQIAVSRPHVAPPSASIPPAAVPVPASPASMAETVHPGVAASETVVPPAAPAAPTPPVAPAQPVAAAPAAPQPAAPLTAAPQAPVMPPAAAVPQATPAPAATSAPAAPSSHEPIRRVETPQPAVHSPNYYVPPVHESSEAAADAQQEGEPVLAKGKKGKKKPGKLPPVSKLNGEDSREAAADTLRKFFQRR
jgi:hypothetical protein